MTKSIERKYVPFVIALAVVAVLGLLAGVLMLRGRSSEPVKVTGRTAYALQFSQDGNTLLGLSLINGHPLLCAWNPQDGRERWRWSFPSEEQSPFCLAQSPDGKYVAAVSTTTESLPAKNVLRLWEISSGQLARTFSWSANREKSEQEGPEKSTKGRKDRIASARASGARRVSEPAISYVPIWLQYLPNGQLRIAYSVEGKRAAPLETAIESFDPATARSIGSRMRFPGYWEIHAISTTGDVVLASNGSKIAIWEQDRTAPIWQTSGKTGVADGNFRFLYVNRGKRLFKLDRSDGGIIWSTPTPAGDRLQLKLAGTRLLTTTAAGSVEVRRIDDGTVQHRFEVTTDYRDSKRPRSIDAIAVSQDGASLAAGGHRYEQDHVLIWRLP